MKKIFSILLALVLVLSFSLATATSVVATVSDVSVGVSPPTIGEEAEYVINFTIKTTLAGGDMIYIEFPADTMVPHTYDTGNVTVEGWNISEGDVSAAGQVVTIRVPYSIGAITEVNVVFTEDAGITNPTTAGIDYTLDVWTSMEMTPVTSSEYTIVLPDKSMYEFVYQPEPEAMDLWRNEPAAFNVTLQTDVEGLHGYNSTRITFNVTEQPAPTTVTFEVYNGTNWVHGGVDSGSWPIAGNFSVGAADNQTFPFRLTFTMVGLYAIEFVLDDLDGVVDLIVDEISFAVTGVSVTVELNKGWNLMSLPIIPDDSDIEDVLADIMGNVTSVHHYDPLLPPPGWLIYAPSYPDSDLTDMDDGKAYWINMIAAANLTVVGQAIAAPGFQGGLPPTYAVWEGWNMVGFRSMDPMPAHDYLEGTDVVRIYGFDLDLGGWFSLTPTSDNMTPNLGYWVAFSEDGTIYP